MSGKSSRSLAVHGTDIRVLLADDEEMSRRGCSAALNESYGITLVGCTRVSTEIHSSIRSCQPDVVLLNSATDSDWAGTVRAILTDLPRPQTPKVIVVTGADIDDRLFLAVQAGATGVLLRNMSIEELRYAVHHVAMGHSVISPAATSYMLARLRTIIRYAGDNIAGVAAVDTLSPRERQILAGLASGRSNREIAAATQLTVATVKSHVSNILAKLDVRDRVQAALLGQLAGIAAEFQLDSVAPACLVQGSRGVA